MIRIILLSLPNWAGVKEKASANFEVWVCSTCTVSKCSFCCCNDWLVCIFFQWNSFLCLFFIDSFLTLLYFFPTLIEYIFLAGSTADLDSITIPRSQLTLVNPNQADQSARLVASSPEGMHFLKCVNCSYEA